MSDLKALIEAAKAAPYQGRWIVEENKSSAWVGTPKGTPPFEKCDDVFFGQDLTGYKPEYIERTLALYRFIALANPSTVAAMAEDLMALREAAEEAKLAISYAMRGTADAEQSDKYAATIRKLTKALTQDSPNVRP